MRSRFHAYPRLDSPFQWALLTVAVLLVYGLLCGEGANASGQMSPAGGTIPPVQDLLPGDPALAHAYPGQFVSAGDFVYFVATDNGAGSELWRSSGTRATTLRVKDIQPGAGSSQPHNLTLVGNRLFFSADDGSNGVELWISRGSAASTMMVKDIFPGLQMTVDSLSTNPANSASPRLLTPFKNTLYFAAHSPAGDGLWRSDGTETGTQPIYNESDPTRTISALAAAGDQLYFVVQTGLTAELWQSDGLTGTVTLLTQGQQIFDLTAASEHGPLLFALYDGTSTQLWQASAGAATPVQTLYPYPNSDEFQFDPQITAAGDGTVYLRGYDESSGVELWRTDSTGQSVTLAQDLNPGPSSSFFVPATNAGEKGKLFFMAFTDSTGYELWLAAGETIQQVRDINPGFANGVQPTLQGALANDLLYFYADDGSHGFELWRSDGTAAGTALLKDILPGPGSNGTLQQMTPLLASFPGGILFGADDGKVGFELWRSDGSAENTVLVRDIRLAGNAMSPPFPDIQPVLDPAPENLTALGDNGLLFSTFDTRHGTRLWRSNGTPNSIAYLKKIDANTRASFGEFMHLTVVRNSVFFAAMDPVSGVELWRSDGTANNTVLVKDIYTDTTDALNPQQNVGSFPTQLTNVRGTLFFAAKNNAEQFELWKSDGSERGTMRVRRSGTNTAPAPLNWLTAVNNQLYYAADDGKTGVELWRSDGSDNGTVLVSDIFPGDSDGIPNSATPSHLIAGEGQLYFFARNGEGYHLWHSDGTAKGTIALTAADSLYDLLQATAEYPMATLGSTLYFVNTDAEHGYELWKSDGTPAGTALVKDIYPGPDGSLPSALAVVDGTLYFSANDGISGYELWKSDGTAEGTVRVADLYLGRTGSLPDAIVALPDGRAVFAAGHEQYGRELWQSDGTAEGTRLLIDLALGLESSNPTALTVTGDRLCFVADNGQTGRELWCIPADSKPFNPSYLYLPTIGR